MTALWLMAIAAGLFCLAYATKKLNVAMAVFGVIFIVLVLLAWTLEAGA